MQPYPMNPVNEFYMRNSQAQMNAQFSQPYQNQYNFPSNPQQPAIHANWVTSVDEARAAQMPDFMSTNVFLDTATGKIYLKRMGNDGRPQFLSYVLENDAPQQKDPLIEINARLSNIENFLGGMKDESVSGNAGVHKSADDANPATASTDEHDGAAESAGVSKNAGNDFWKKRR